MGGIKSSVTTTSSESGGRLICRTSFPRLGLTSTAGFKTNRDGLVRPETAGASQEHSFAYKSGRAIGSSTGIRSYEELPLMRTSTFVVQLSAALLAAPMFASAQSACDNLKSFSLPGVEFTAVETVAAGPYTAPAGAGRGAGGPAALNNGPALQPGARPATPPQMLPAHCRVAATLQPSS